MTDIGELSGPKVFADKDQTADSGGGHLAVVEGTLYIRGSVHSRALGQLDQLERISYAKYERDRLQKGDVLLRSKGRPMVAAEFKEKSNSSLPTIAAAAVLILRPKAHLITPRYLVWMLNSRWAQQIFSNIRSGKHIPVISVRVLKDVMVPLPALAEQESIQVCRRHAC